MVEDVDSFLVRGKDSFMQEIPDLRIRRPSPRTLPFHTQLNRKMNSPEIHRFDMSMIKTHKNSIKTLADYPNQFKLV